MKHKNALFLAVISGWLLAFPASEAGANVIIKVRALNPLETEETAAIRYPLPEEIVPDDIRSKKITFSLPQEEGEERKTTLNVEYIEEEGRYYIVDEVLLKPREVVTLEVHVADIWFIDQGRLDGIKKTVEDLIAQSRPSSPEEGEESIEPDEEWPDETVLVLRDEIFRGLDEIAKRQEESSVLKVGVEPHMEAYYENTSALVQVESDVSMLRYLLEPEEEEGPGEEAEQAGIQEDQPGDSAKDGEGDEEILEEINLQDESLSPEASGTSLPEDEALETDRDLVK